MEENVLSFKTFKKINRVENEIKELNVLIKDVEGAIVKLLPHKKYQKVMYITNELRDTRKRLLNYLEDKENHLLLLERNYNE